MKTFAIVYRFADEQAVQKFRESTINTFRNVRERETEKFHYIGLVARQEPEVEDKLAGIIRQIKHHGRIEHDDYVGIYFSPDYDQDSIKRHMAFGKDEYIENDVTPGYRPEHFSIITDLLDYDPVKSS